VVNGTKGKKKRLDDCAMNEKFELLAPGGDLDSIKAAIVAGADAIYCGLNQFNARNRATNIEFEDLIGVLKLAHKNHCKVFLTLNIIILDCEISSLIGLLNKLVNTGIDGLIVQDLGLFYLLSEYFKDLEVHASTQCTTHNNGQIRFLNKLAATRVNLSRELNIDEIKELTRTAHGHDISTEVFVHGSYCLAFSGLCYISSILCGNSGNRGRCSQPCRDRYLTTPAGSDFPLNLKDNSAYFDLKELSDAGVDSLKIEGRIKKFHYVYTVVRSWKKQINHDGQSHDNRELYTVFNRDFSNGYLKGDINNEMFIDNPLDHSAIHLFELRGHTAAEDIQDVKKELYDEKTDIRTTISDKIKNMSVSQGALIINISGELNTPLKVSVTTPDSSFDVLSETNLINADRHTLDSHSIEKRFRSLGNGGYYIEHINLENLQKDLFMSFHALTVMKNRILFLLNGSKKIIAPIEVPILKKKSRSKAKPALSVLISSPTDLHLCDTTSADIYYKLPDCLNHRKSELISLFLENRKIIPWFPAVLIGENYTAAVDFLEQVQPERIVTNNTGVAFKAYENGIPWIAGPYLNITNSFSLLAMKEKFNCCGSFISNEINQNQMRKLATPDDFQLYYSIYHPILLLTTRQCLFHQTIGCDKTRVDDQCLQECNKFASITNLKGVSLRIDKKAGDYHCMYNDTNFLNTDIITELPDLFSGFFIDLRDISTDTNIERDKTGIVKLFENLLHGDPDSEKELNQMIHPSTNAQYKKGL
jgi:putative protease